MQNPGTVRRRGNHLLTPSERAGFEILVRFAFMIFLVFALGKRVFTRRETTSDGQNSSVFAEARSAAYAAIGYAYLV